MVSFERVPAMLSDILHSAFGLQEAELGRSERRLKMAFSAAFIPMRLEPGVFPTQRVRQHQHRITQPHKGIYKC